MQIYSTWLSLSISVRHQIAHKLGIVKKFPTEVQDNQIKTDGYVLKDIEEALSIENLQKYLETDETDHATLLKWLIEGKPQTGSGVISPEIEKHLEEIKVVKTQFNGKRGRPAKIK